MCVAFYHLLRVVFDLVLERPSIPVSPENHDRLQNRARNNDTGVKFAHWQNVGGAQE